MPIDRLLGLGRARRPNEGAQGDGEDLLQRHLTILLKSPGWRRADLRLSHSKQSDLDQRLPIASARRTAIHEGLMICAEQTRRPTLAPPRRWPQATITVVMPTPFHQVQI